MTQPSVTIVNKSSEGWHIKQIIASMAKKGIACKAIDFDNASDFAEQMKKLDEITIWRTSSLSIAVQRSSVAAYLDKTYMINEAVFLQPGTSQKFYQQQALRANKSLAKYAIPTYRVPSKRRLQELLDTQQLSLPVIAKPFDGCRGEGIYLLRTIDDVDTLTQPMGTYVLQSFIANTGDWRVIVVGGRAVGVMKRVAREGAFLNNISQGATSYNETDETIRRTLCNIAAKTAALFRLRFCGVDIIQNASTGQYSVLEVNTAPQWDGEFGFESVTGVSVADELAEYVSSVIDRMSGERHPHDIVDTYYKAHIGDNAYEAFHYASRRWLWDRDAWARETLDAMKTWYMGDTEADYAEKIKNILDKTDTPPTVNEHRSYRRVYFERYRMLSSYNSILFKVIFAESLYDIDLRPYVQQYVSDAEFLELFHALRQDHEAVRVLSTHAINYLYLLKNYFRKKASMISMVLANTTELLDIASDYEKHIATGELSRKDALKLEIYLLTHAIIGQSRFYQRRVNLDTYKVLCKRLEEIIAQHYFDISLDNKLEFLVCAEMCSYESVYRTLILQEAAQSFSWAGNFLVDRDADAVRHCLRPSEHRNVLYVMASKSWVVKNKPKPIIPPLRKKIGRLARVDVPEYTLHDLVARVDTGATRSSICASDVREENDTLYFKLLYPDHPMYTGVELSTRQYAPLFVKNPGKKRDKRFLVMIELSVDNDHTKVFCTLSDRQHMLYPVLLGRDFLGKRYYVDMSKRFMQTTTTKERRS